MTTETPTSTPAPPPPEEDQPTAGGSMTLLEHLLELRSRVTWMAAAIALGSFVFFLPPIGFTFISWMLEPARDATGDPDFRPQFIEPLENIVTFFQVGLLGGISVAMPVIVYHLLRFVSPALTKSERRWVSPIAIGASLSFLAGIAFAYWVVLPLTLSFLLTFGDEVAEPELRIGSYINFVTRMMLVLGLVFETPLVVMGLAKLRVVTAGQLIRRWRFALVGSFLVSAIVTPTIDPVTQSLVAGPMIVLYFIGAGLAWLVRR